MVDQQAASLHAWPGAAVDGAWELRYADGRKLLYVGSEQVEKARAWVKAAVPAVEEYPPVLVITGLVKVRCSCCARRPLDLCHVPCMAADAA